jgi:predicted nucleotide-binding protein
MGGGVPQSAMKPKDLAHHKVVFEHEYLMSKLGRENVCSLVKGNIEIPIDVTGVVYVTLDEHGACKTDVAKDT